MKLKRISVALFVPPGDRPPTAGRGQAARRGVSPQTPFYRRFYARAQIETGI